MLPIRAVLFSTHANRTNNNTTIENVSSSIAYLILKYISLVSEIWLFRIAYVVIKAHFTTSSYVVFCLLYFVPKTIFHIRLEQRGVLYAHRVDTEYVVSQFVLSAHTDFFLSICRATSNLGNCRPDHWLNWTRLHDAVLLSVRSQTWFDSGTDRWITEA